MSTAFRFRVGQGRIDQVVEDCVRDLIRKGPDGETPVLDDGTDLFRAGMTSEDGLELACMLQAQLGIRIPDDVNPCLHDSGRRMLNLGELKVRVRRYAQACA